MRSESEIRKNIKVIDEVIRYNEKEETQFLQKLRVSRSVLYWVLGEVLDDSLIDWSDLTQLHSQTSGERSCPRRGRPKQG